MRTIKNLLSFLMIVIVISGVLAGCNNSDSDASDSASGEDITLEFQQWWEPELPEGYLQEIADDFNEETGIKVELLSNPYSDTKQQITAGAASGKMGDIVGLDGTWVYDLVKQGAIADLGQLMDEVDFKDGKLTNQTSIDGTTYMMHVVNFANPMYVNKNILKDVGIEETPETWSEFEEALRKIKESTDNSGWLIPFATQNPNGVQNSFMNLLWASGGSMLDDNGKPNLTNNDKMTETLEYTKELFDDNLIPQSVFSMQEQDMSEEFANERVAFMMDSLAHLTTLQKDNPDLDIEIAELPAQDDYDGEKGLNVGNWGVGVTEDSDHKEEAMQFIEYLMEKEINADLADKANAFPGNKESELDLSNKNEQYKEAYRIFQESVAVREFNGLPTAEELQRNFADELIAYTEGDTESADDMLEKTQKKWKEAFE